MSRHNIISEYANAAMSFDGDIVEIGIGHGETTVELLKVAYANNRKLIGIDPYKDGWGNMPESYRYIEPYIETINHPDCFTLYKINSLSKEAQEICSGKVAFAFIDGLQFKGAVLSDLRILSHAKVIMIDDFDRSTSDSQVPEAIDEYMKFNPNKKLINKGRLAIII